VVGLEGNQKNRKHKNRNKQSTTPAAN